MKIEGAGYSYWTHPGPAWLRYGNSVFAADSVEMIARQDNGEVWIVNDKDVIICTVEPGEEADRLWARACETARPLSSWIAGRVEFEVHESD